MENLEEFAVEEHLEDGLRYTEEVGRTVRSLPVRYCLLWKDDEKEPVSELEVLSFKQRFGLVASDCEGIGGVETLQALDAKKSYNWLNKQLDWKDVKTLHRFNLFPNSAIIFVKTHNSLHGVRPLPKVSTDLQWRRVSTINIERSKIV